jgi:hypothetical protein
MKMKFHTVPTDPGVDWVKDEAWAIDAPPDSESNPLPDASWPEDAARSGICGTVAPNVVPLLNGGYRMYYTQILPRPGFPGGANDYDNSMTRILSASSADGLDWTPDAGTRLSPQEGGAGDFRVVSSEVVPVETESGMLRMYFECCPGPQSGQSTIRSASSEDGGLSWRVEPGVRIGEGDRGFSSPRLINLDDGRYRLYFSERGVGIISALSVDGLEFQEEEGIRIRRGDRYDAFTAFAPEVLRIADGAYRMYYSGYSAADRAQILTAFSEDGLSWQKASEPVIVPGGSRWDSTKCSEMCVAQIADEPDGRPRYRIYYEACDGTAANKRGVWRIASATSA